jgi:hypothetical protein
MLSHIPHLEICNFDNYFKAVYQLNATFLWLIDTFSPRNSKLAKKNMAFVGNSSKSDSRITSPRWKLSVRYQGKPISDASIGPFFHEK